MSQLVERLKHIRIVRSIVYAIVGIFSYPMLAIVNKLKIEGTENIENLPKGNVLFVSNHQTYFADVITFLHIFCAVKWRRRNRLGVPFYLLNPFTNVYYVAAEETMKGSWISKLFTLAGALTVKRTWRATGTEVRRGLDPSDTRKIERALSSSWVITFPQGTTKPFAPARKGTAYIIKNHQVWNDRDGDGKRDPNEPSIPGAPISLYTDNNADNLPDGGAIRTTTSDAQGRYLFINLPAGRYIASMPILPGYQQSPNTSTQATSPFPDNNIDDDNNLVRLVGPNAPGGILYTNAITLSEGDEPTTDGDGANGNLTFDLAECGNAFIGDFVWHDLNANGIQDAGEPGINGVTVTITFPDGTTATEATHTYNAPNNLNAPQYDGYYDFENLGPGTYKITFATPQGYTPSPANQGGNDAKDSDPVNGSVMVTIAANQSDFTIDAGFCKPGAIVKLTLGNQVWNDRDGDGKRDPNEPSIPGAPISLYTDNNADNLPDGGAIRTTTSDAQGRYLFINLPAGRYIASMPILPGYQQSPNTSTQATSPFPDNNVDNDNNLVRLVGPNAPGGILYTNAITLSEGDEPTTDGDGANGNLTFDLAECGNAFIGDFVWNDLNGNGIQDAGEPGINGVTVTITFPDGTTATEATHTYNAPNNQNAPQYDGYYDFENLGPGTYKITFETPAGLNPSPANQGVNDAKDSDPVNGSVMVTIAANQSDFTIDAGFTDFVAPPPPPACPNLSLGNLVFNDANGSGKKDTNEQGIAGLTVKLYRDDNGNNSPDGAAISTIMTAADGTYLFSNLSAGKYIVGVVLQSGYSESSLGSSNPDNNIDNDNNGVRTANGEVQSNSITLSAGDEPINDGSDNNSNLTLDFGLKMASVPCTDHCDCKNDCNHSGCGHSNCGHNSCKNDCKHTGCGHSNCGHNSCKNDCNHSGCGHSNCGHNSCKNDCKHTGCGHSNCGHNSCKNDCNHTGCGHSNCKKKDKDKDDKDKDKDDDRDRYGRGENREITKTTIGVYPNPAINYFVLNVNSAKEGAAVIRVTDATGKIMHTRNTKVLYGRNSIKITETSRLKSGTYNVQLLVDGEVISQKLIMTK